MCIVDYSLVGRFDLVNRIRATRTSADPTGVRTTPLRSKVSGRPLDCAGLLVRRRAPAEQRLAFSDVRIVRLFPKMLHMHSSAPTEPPVVCMTGEDSIIAGRWFSEMHFPRVLGRCVSVTRQTCSVLRTRSITASHLASLHFGKPMYEVASFPRAGPKFGAASTAPGVVHLTPLPPPTPPSNP